MGYIWPVDPEFEVTQEFGANPGATLPDGTPVNPPGGHTGRDFATPIGTPVVAVGDGVIDFAGQADWTPNDNPLWMMGSICIILNCGDAQPDFTYGHLSSVSVTAGQSVRQGQVIGYTGNTGASTGPHLHFEALPPGYALDQRTYGRVDPRRYCTGFPSGLEPQANDITPIDTEGFLMTLSDQDQIEVRDNLRKVVGALGAAEGPGDVAEIRDNVRKLVYGQLTPEQVAAAIPTDIAQQVFDELGKRLQTGAAHG
ncbi:M23 family metallopeptidase [Sinomonas sp. JGH33]|uniref:M23 family metallopeptidase n=1 Tax=Sinomonas terricola TaxID=3110330 RepID=A0ABU5T4D5_9MICC|nr:M23 family metallopeptidase [Sinomonas sp. JGH33]MEA5454463.1 M23 family metallopeptidase [Sinomonas sp. JGH33]